MMNTLAPAAHHQDAHLNATIKAYISINLLIGTLNSKK